MMAILLPPTPVRNSMIVEEVVVVRGIESRCSEKDVLRQQTTESGKA